jgi:hypothetical protein
VSSGQLHTLAAVTLVKESLLLMRQKIYGLQASLSMVAENPTSASCSLTGLFVERASNKHVKYMHSIINLVHLLYY